MKNQESIKIELGILIKKYHLEKELNIEEIIRWITEEDEPDGRKANQDFQNKWFKYFQNVSDIDEINIILEAFTDAWNYFPHKSLNNKSPMQMFKK